jgi:NAD+ kinase
VKLAVRGDDELAQAAAAAGATLTGAETADLVVTVGEAEFVAVACDAPETPVLPVGADLGPFSLSPARDDLEDALDSLAAAEGSAVAHPVLSATVDGDEVARGVLDAMLVTSEPARISEYEVDFGDERVTDFRSDGVVVATPLGTHGYAHAAGAPVLQSGTGLAVVPVAPFSTRSSTWVADDDVTLTVARDDGPVSLVVDGAEVRSVEPHQSVRLRVVDTVDLWRLPEMRLDRLEKL